MREKFEKSAKCAKIENPQKMMKMYICKHIYRPPPQTIASPPSKFLNPPLGLIGGEADDWPRGGFRNLLGGEAHLERSGYAYGDFKRLLQCDPYELEKNVFPQVGRYCSK